MDERGENGPGPDRGGAFLLANSGRASGLITRVSGFNGGFFEMACKMLLPGLLVAAFTAGGASASASQQPAAEGRSSGESKAAVATYENLANAIIAINKTEDELIKTVLLGYRAAAMRHFRLAARDKANREAHFEAAAAEISNIANEGDAAIRAVRQRLSQAGHTHNTDVETKEDYIFVTNRERKELLALAQEVAKLGADATPEALREIATRLSKLVDKALAPE